ncbi:heme-binding protein soul4 [Aplochiton taeniatus]
MALISLEDLDEFDDQQEDDITDVPEPMDEQEHERLYRHWQAVASTHQVAVPRDMTGPITEMTHQQEREEVPFVSVSRHEKLDGQVLEERLYPAGHWACVSRSEKLYEQSISMSFMKLMRFICKENSLGRQLSMTVPVVSTIHVLEDGETFEKEVLTAYYLPAEFQTNLPQPADPDITIILREPFRVITWVFLGNTTEETISQQIRVLWEELGQREDLQRRSYMVAAFQNPAVPCRKNEIWFLRREPHPDP